MTAVADAHGELVEALDARVRTVVRREGVDPQADVPHVRRIAEAAVRDHDERSLTGVVTATLAASTGMDQMSCCSTLLARD